MTEYIYAIDGQQGYSFTGEEIIRCRDCVKWDYDSTYPKKACFEFSNPEDGYIIVTGPDGFCAWGSRRNDTENGMEVQ